MPHGSALEQDVWVEFADKKGDLATLAQAIRDNFSTLPPGDIEDFDDDMEAAEGRILARVHRRRERNRKLVTRKKKQVLQQTGKLACEVCGFDFEVPYGSRGTGFAECHHEIPLSELKPGDKTKLTDLRIVCANCHRMIHRKRPWLTVADLRSLMEQMD